MRIRTGFPESLSAVLAASVLLPCAAGVARAQAGRGSISGLVTDAGGALVSGANVVLRNQAKGTEQRTVTSSAGLYTFISLSPGTYTVTVSQKGFQRSVVENLTVTVDQVTQVNVTMTIGAVNETVTVTGGTELIEASNSTVGQLVDAKTIDRVPLLYRNVFDLVQLSAGVSPPNGSPNSSDSMQSVQNISSGRPGVDISAATINGAIVGSVYYMVDGSPIGVAENNAAAVIPAMNIPEDGIDEVRVETQNTPASYQSGAAGVISLVTKSGTNAFFGDVFGVFRPNALSANEYFNKQTQMSDSMANKPPDFYRYQEGAAIGGPIKRDKLFFFGDYEDTQQKQFEGIDYFTVPTSNERTGNFSNLASGIYDPTRPDLPNGTRQQFPGGIIPNPNPIGLLFLSKMPHCNLPNPTTCDAATSDSVNNYGVPGLDPFHAHRFDVRVDWAQSERQHIFGRFSYDKLIFSTANAFPSGWDIGYAQNTTNGRNILLADDLTLNSSTVLNLRYSFTRHFENQGNPAYSNTDITNLGSVNGATVGFPSALAAEQISKQLPIMVFGDVGGGVGGTGDGNNFRYASENSDVNVSLTKILGKHQLSFGFEWMKRYLNVGQPGAPAGAYEFDVSATDQSVSSAVGGSDFASMLVGMAADPTGADPEQNFYPNFTKDIFGALSNPYYGSFVEDTFHLSNTLTLTGGLRWDIFSGETERFNRMEYFNPTVSNTYNGVGYTGAEIFSNSRNRSPFATNLRDFGPRVAFSWQAQPHLVVRGGAGIYYGPSTHMVQSAGNTSDGFASHTVWNGTCLNVNGNTVFNGTGCGTNTGSTQDNFTVPYSISNPFPAGVVPIFKGTPTGLANNLGISLSSVFHSQPTPTVYNFNFAVEYELPHQVVVTAAYVGSRGLHLPFSSIDLNVLDLATIGQYKSALTSSTAPNQWASILPPTNANYGSATVPLFVALEKYPQFGDGNYGSGNGVNIHGAAAGDSEYSSLQAKVQKRLTDHFTTLTTFTWGKIMTDDGNPPLGFVGTHNGTVQDWHDLKLEHSISPQDVKFQFNSQVSYDLPIGEGRAWNVTGVANQIFGGWTANGILYLSTGVPINSPLSGLSPSFFNQRADMTCNPGKHAPHTPAVWFNANCFALPGTEGSGNAANVNPYVAGNSPAYLDHVRTKGARDLDLSVYKAFKFSGAKALRFDVSGYNISNTPQFGYPSVPSLVAATQQGIPFGQITNTINTPRQFQFGGRFTF